MDLNNLSAMEIDAIGEILNISLGASATAVSTMLDTRVDITTPVVSVQAREEFEFRSIEPAVGVEIGYVEGLDGSNIMLLKRCDVKVIVEMLMGMQIPDEEFELNEMNISAVCEVMNQMMGASATALSELLSKTVNISTPVSFEVESPEQFKQKYFGENDRMVVVGFNLTIMDKLESEFLNLMPIRLAKELVQGFFPDMELEEPQPAAAKPSAAQAAAQEDSGGGKTLSQEEIERLMQGGVEPQPSAAQPSAAQAAAQEDSGGGKALSQEEIERLMQGGVEPQPSAAKPSAAQAAAQAEPGGGKALSQEEIERLMQGGVEPQPSAAQPSAAQAAQPVAAQAATAQPAAAQAAVQPQIIYAQQPSMDPEIMNNMMQMMEMMRKSLELQQQQIQESAPKKLKVRPAPQPNLKLGDIKGDAADDNLDMMLDVPMEISVEIGRTQKLVKDILELNKGSLVVLDKLAGEQVDLYVNGQCLAKGDVVVVDDNFGIRITDIM